MKKVITFGVYDYFHLGHLRLFKQCKEHGDYLIVAVQEGDFILKYKPEAKVLYTTEQRIEMVEAIRIVDEVITYEVISPEFLEKIDFDVLALGEDHVAERWQKSAEWCLAHGKEVVRLKRTKGICSTDIKKRLSGQ
ncbi:MAG: adenylyltransferase/cytidyltransferase family protein [Candidatus Saccharibacteria bacterium]|nr:adenylyltransferase/cytidyltransferase family protein [Candidatus Saccharibacteria bacterium]